MTTQIQPRNILIVESDDDDRSVITTLSAEDESSQVNPPIDNLIDEADDEADEEGETEEEEIDEVVADPVPAPPVVVHQPFPLKLNKADWTTTIFAKKKMIEHVNPRQVHGFIKGEMGITYQDNARYGGLPVEIKTELDQMVKLNDLTDKAGIVRQAHTLPRHKWGRTIPVGYASLSVLHRPTRHALCDPFYVDKDMINCQPSVILAISDQHELGFDGLRGYVAKHKDYRRLIARDHGCSIDVAKMLPICLMFGGSYSGWIRDNDIQLNTEEGQRVTKVKKIEGEMRTMMELVYTANKHIVTDVHRQDPNKWTTVPEQKRGVMALWSQTIERHLMETCVKHLVDTRGLKLEEIVPCQDGLMVLKQHDYPEMIAEFSQIIADKLRFNIGWADKAFDEAIEIPEYDVEEVGDVFSVKYLADRLVQEHGDHIIFIKSGDSRELFVWANARWANETDPKNRYGLSRIISEDLYNLLREEVLEDLTLTDKHRELTLKNLRRNTEGNGQFGEITRHALSLLVYRNQEVKFNAQKNLLGFNNGVLDLYTGDFRDIAYDDYISLSTGWNYSVPEETEENLHKAQVLVNLMDSIEDRPEYQHCLSAILASCLDGHNYQNFFFFNGEGGNGKGTLMKLMKRVLGSDYCTCDTGGIIASGKKTANGATPDMADLRNKRLVSFTEMGGMVSNSAIKLLSGGDPIKARQLNQGNKEFELSCTNIGQFNSTPTFDEMPSASEYRRYIDYQFKNVFTSDATKVGTITPKGETYKQANKYFETTQFVEGHYQFFFQHLLQTYRENLVEGEEMMTLPIPDEIRRKSKAMVDNLNVFKEVFESNFEIDPDQNNDIKEKRIPFKQIWETIKYSDTYRGITKEQERQYNAKALAGWLRGLIGHRFVEPPNNRAKYCWGLKRIGEEEEDDNDHDLS